MRRAQAKGLAIRARINHVSLGFFRAENGNNAPAPAYDIDGIGRGIYAAARLDPSDPPKRGSFEVAERFLGKKAVYEREQDTESTTAIVNGRTLIVIRKGMSAPRANEVVALELVRIHLGPQTWFCVLDKEQRNALAYSVGRWLVAPTPALARRIQLVGEDPERIAAGFTLTLDGAKQRLLDFTGPPRRVDNLFNLAFYQRRAARAENESVFG